jgi:hypothetical protein
MILDDTFKKDYSMAMTDKEIIEFYGGGTKLARKLGLLTHHDRIKVNLWKSRGIPAKIKLQYPEIFLKRKFKD